MRVSSHFLLCPQHFQSQRALETEFKVSLRSQSLEIESLLHLELPTSCYGNTTSATRLCSSGHWIWHLPRYCWFCISPPGLLCSRRIVSHFSCRVNIYSESRLQREEGLNLCVLRSRGSRRRLACGAINSSNLWIDVLHVPISKPPASRSPDLIR